jgi:hypothetical protein
MLVSTALIYYGCYATIGFVSGFIAGVYRDLYSAESKVTIGNRELDDGICKTLSAGLICGTVVALSPFILILYGCKMICETISNIFNM